MDLTFWTQQVIYGLTLGCLYGLIAIGYTMVYGVLRLINFAHGDLLMVASYIAFYGVLMFRLPWMVAHLPWPLSEIPWLLSALISVLLTAVLGILIDRGAYRPIRNSPRISALITAIGVSFLLENLGLVILGGRHKTFPRPAMLDPIYHVAGLHIPSLSLWIFGVTALLLALVLFIVYRSRVGMAMRALSRDFETVRLMGVDVNRVISFTFALGSALAAAGGIMWSAKHPALEPLMGILPGIKAFIAAVLGGIGSVAGAALGGISLGLAEVLIVAYVGDQWQGYRDAIAFTILIVILLIRPTGLMGEKLPN